jgi:N utilization substance protein B
VAENKIRRSGPGPGELRRRARRLALQAMYQWQVSKAPVMQIETEFLLDNDSDKFDKDFFRALFEGITHQVKELDAALLPFLDRDLKDLDHIELALIRMGCFELKERLDVPYRVAINEGVELAKKFGGTDGYKFVNGMLDKLAGTFRQPEVQANRNQRV